MVRFEYYEPKSLTEAIVLLGRHSGAANILAGGTDLLVEIKDKIRKPQYLVNIKRIPGLDTFAFDEEQGVRFGATVTARQIETAPIIKEKYLGLWQAVRELGSIQVRNRATVVGNICRASPSADTLPPMIADDALVHIVGSTGERTVPMEIFFIGPGQTVLLPDDVVTGITIPAPSGNTGKVYIKHGRRKAMELASVGVAVRLVREGDRCQEARIVLGAVAPTPIRAKQAEAILTGHAFSQALVEKAAEAARQEARPISDVRASQAYRAQMVEVLTRRALRSAWEAAYNPNTQFL